MHARLRSVAACLRLSSDAVSVQPPPRRVDRMGNHCQAMMKTCPFCREEVHGDAIRCRYCQANLLSVQPPAPAPEDGRHVTYVVDRDLIRFAKFTAAVLAVFIVVGAYFFGFKLEASVEKLGALQTEVEKASEELKKSQVELLAAKTTVATLETNVQLVLAEAKKTLGEIHAQHDDAIAAVVSIRKLNPVQEQVLSQAKATETNKARGTGKYWAIGATIRIAFIGGSAKQREIVKQAAVDWTKHANLHFQFVESGDADVRIAFESSAGSWSFVGTDALGVAKTAPTMNLGWVRRENVLHEFGHAIGLIEEHQNPRATIRWNKDEIMKELTGPPNFWSVAQIEEKVFRKVPLREVGEYRDFDPRSIMTFAFPASQTGGVAIGGATDLSESDRQLVRRLYPPG
ncbi:M12 family metallopeptidase [Pseudoduganella lutea]|uniref:Peptidase M12A domain-containing protein n=1 Tax=Pseudoduganella lutea TaxID=321985 RepID=A0A4P6L4Q2_9BURK|nr:M12 family metallopeptidase [Pseudoduganella lutea]QBE66580.1 hypothetical protein EWM63_29410 [Pseudoduganella lutea]